MGDLLRLKCSANYLGLPSRPEDWHILDVPLSQVEVVYNVGIALMYLSYVCPKHEEQQIITRKPGEIIELTDPCLMLPYVEVNGVNAVEGGFDLPDTVDAFLIEAERAHPEGGVIDITRIISNTYSSHQIAETQAIFWQLSAQP